MRCTIRKNIRATFTYTRKWLVFEKLSAPDYYLWLTPRTACYLQTEKNALYSIVFCQYKVLLIDYCNAILSLVGNRDLSIKQE